MASNMSNTLRPKPAAVSLLLSTWFIAFVPRRRADHPTALNRLPNDVVLKGAFPGVSGHAALPNTNRAFSLRNI